VMRRNVQTSINPPLAASRIKLFESSNDPIREAASGA
jgi:hypothetical protein